MTAEAASSPAAQDLSTVEPVRTSSVDVVTVPDFEGPRREHFTARILLFLGCWSEFGGRSRSLALHLACIGTPPPSVRWLTDRCGASIHVCSAVAAGRWRGMNKLRGLEIPTRSERVLLVDADVLVLSDITAIARVGAGLAAAPAFRARVPADYWATIYRGLDLPVPAVPPYFNSGVVLVPTNSDLRALWEHYVRRIAALFGPESTARRAVAESDQAGFAAAIVALGRQGVPFVPLPEHFNAGWPHLYRRAPPLRDVALFHAVGLFGRTHRADRSVSWNIDRYCYQVVRRLVTAWRRDPQGRLRPGRLATRLAPALADGMQLRQKLQLVHRKYVAPALLAGRR